MRNFAQKMMGRTMGEHWENAKFGLSKYRVLIPLALMIVPEIAKTLSPDSTAEDVADAQMNIAYLLGFTVLSEVVTNVIGNVRNADDTSAINTVPATLALAAAATAAITSGVMFAEPGPEMTKIGPWIIGASSTIAYLAAHNAIKSNAQQTAALETEQSETTPSFLRRATEAAGSPVGVIVTIALPIMIAEIIERCMSIAHNDKLKLIAPFAADGAWAFGSAVQTLLTALAASDNIAKNKKIIDALFLMVITEVAGLTMLATLVGHADSMNVSAPFIGRALLLAAMGCSAKVRMEIDADLGSENGIHGIATGTNILNKFAVLFRDTGITLMLAIKAMHLPDPQKTLYRKTMEGVLSIQVLDSLATLWFSMDLPKTEWRKPAFAAFIIQALMLGSTFIQPTASVGKHDVDIRPALGIISAVAYYMFKQIRDLDCQRALELANPTTRGRSDSQRSDQSMQGAAAVNASSAPTQETNLLSQQQGVYPVQSYAAMFQQARQNFRQYPDGIVQGIPVYQHAAPGYGSQV